MKDEIRELTATDFARAIPRRLRDRFVRGDFKGGKDIAALRRFTALSQEAFPPGSGDQRAHTPQLGAGQTHGAASEQRRHLLGDHPQHRPEERCGAVQGQERLIDRPVDRLRSDGAAVFFTTAAPSCIRSPFPRMGRLPAAALAGPRLGR